MRELYLASELTKRPVVTLGGEAVAQVKDTVFDGGSARVAGFTLAGRGLFSGPLHRGLPWAGVHALGPDALMIPDTDAVADRAAVASGAEAASGLVRGTEVLTDRGVAVGTVLDVVVVSGRAGEPGPGGEVVGVRIASNEALGHHEREVYLALPGPVAMTGDTVLVPAAGTEHLAPDLVQLDHLVARLRAVDMAGQRTPQENQEPHAHDMAKGGERAKGEGEKGAGNVLMVLTQLRGSTVVDAAGAARLGAVDGLVLDASPGSRARIAALRLRDAKSEHEVIAWADVHAVGPDAVIVAADRPKSPNSAAASALSGSSESQELLGQRLLTDLGQEIGTLDDLTFDTGTGRVERLASSRGEQLPGERLIGVGTYALVVVGTVSPAAA
ncbi:PRC-barrel domain-containing protein [Streptomyces aurantiacus]|uniref:PRC-barrel domain-containing protein n=1 Tax=Streptomyces aurantiacus TaxID=47760 RepID=UPI00332EAC7D